MQFELDDKNPAFYLNRGVANQNLGNFKAAIQDYSQAIKWNQQYSEAYLHRAQAYEKTGAAPDALADYQSVLTLRANTEDVQFAEARIRALTSKAIEQSTFGSRVLLHYNDTDDENTVAELRKALRENLRAVAIPAAERVFGPQHR